MVSSTSHSNNSFLIGSIVWPKGESKLNTSVYLNDSVADLKNEGEKILSKKVI